MLTLEAQRIVQRPDPVVVDAFAVEELDAEVAQAGEAVGLRRPAGEYTASAATTTR